MENRYDSMTLANLRELAKEKGLKNITSLKKSELVEVLNKTDSEDKKAEMESTVLPQNAGNQAEQAQSEMAQAEQAPGAGREERRQPSGHNEIDQLDSGETKVGILEVLPDGYGFIRCDNYLPGENDVYVSPAQIRRFNLKTGDIVAGNTRIRSQNEKFSALLYVKSVNGFHPNEAQKRKKFEDLTPIFPNERIHLETPGAGVSMRMVDLISPIGKGQRGMIVSQPKTGKTTLLKQIAKAVTKNHPDMKLIILLIDERPEEVTDIKESIEGRNVEVIYSTFDELPDNHKRVSEMVIERAKRLVEHKQDVIILLDSITRLARAYNLTVQPSGRTLSGGLDPAALHMPKKFFGAARNMREGGSLTILATALVDTGSRMDDVVFEEFKGTGNMELVLDRSLSEKRIFPAIDLPRSSTRREDLLLSQSELEATYLMRKALGGLKSEEALERIIDMFLRTKTNTEFIETIKKTKIVF
jgi:transcription termination factor Rho